MSAYNIKDFKREITVMLNIKKCAMSKEVGEQRRRRGGGAREWRRVRSEASPELNHTWHSRQRFTLHYELFGVHCQASLKCCTILVLGIAFVRLFVLTLGVVSWDDV